MKKLLLGMVCLASLGFNVAWGQFFGGPRLPVGCTDGQLPVYNLALNKWQCGTGSGVTIATQAEAEAGVENTHMMTPLRTKQAIDALGGGGTTYVAGPTGGIVIDTVPNPDTIDIVTTVVPTKAGANVFTGSNDFSGASTLKLKPFIDGFGYWSTIDGNAHTSMTSTVMSNSNNQVRSKAIYLPGISTFAVASVYVVTASAASSCYVGVYDTTGARVYQSAAIDSSTTGGKTAAFATTLQQGWYRVAWGCTASAVRVTGKVGTGASGGGMILNANTTLYTANAANAVDAGGLPATLGALTSSDVDLPMIAFLP